MFKHLENTSLFNEVSNRLGDIIFISNILLRGELVLSRRLPSVEDLEHILGKVCSDKTCYVHVRFYDKNDREIGELKILLHNGYILGTVLGAGTETIVGLKALNSVDKVKDKDVSYIRAVVYKISDEILSEQDRELLRKATEELKKPPQRKVEKPEERREVVKEKPEEKIMRKLEEIGVPVVNIVLAEGKKYTVLDIICDEDREIPDPKNIVLAAIRYFLDEAGGKHTGKIKVAVHHKKTYSETIDVGKDADVYILIGSIPEIVWKHNLFIDKYKYKLRGNELELSLVLRRSGIYSTINIRDIVKIIYDKIKDKWKGELILKAKIGTWGLEAKYPE